MFATVRRLRHDDGSYWTGWQYVNENHFPAERSGWTSAAVVLAADALTGFSAGAAIFRAVPGHIDPARRLTPTPAAATPTPPPPRASANADPTAHGGRRSVTSSCVVRDGRHAEITTLLVGPSQRQRYLPV